VIKMTFNKTVLAALLAAAFAGTVQAAQELPELPQDLLKPAATSSDIAPAAQPGKSGSLPVQPGKVLTVMPPTATSPGSIGAPAKPAKRAPAFAGESTVDPEVAKQIKPKEVPSQQMQAEEGAAKVIPGTGSVRSYKAQPAGDIRYGYSTPDGKMVYSTAPAGSAPAPQGADQVVMMPMPGQPAPAQQPASAVPMPGLGVPPNAYIPAKPYVANVTPGANEMIAISQTLPNRIATPFADPQVVDVSGSQINTLGGSVYIVPAGTDPIGIYITDKPTDKVPNPPTVSLTLVPKAIPGQTVIVQVDSASMHGIGAQALEEEKPAQSYVDGIRSLLRNVIRSNVPSGFVDQNLSNIPAATMGQLRIQPVKRLSGQSMDVYIYRIDNVGNGGIELTEQSFYQKNVKAVAFFPNIKLDKKGTTRVFILADKVEK